VKLHWLSVGKERYIEVDDDISFKLVSVDINKANVFSVRGPENSSNLFCTLSRELVVCQNIGISSSCCFRLELEVIKLLRY